PAPNPDVVEAVIGPGGGSLGLPDGSATLTFPAGSVSESTTVRIERTTAPPVPASQQLASSAVDLTARTAAGNPVATFAAPVDITLAYTGSPPDGVFFWTGSAWTPVDSSTVDSGSQ